MSDSQQDNAGFIYVLQNDSHDPYVVKVGLTRRSPSKRGAELYQGSSGVPEHFDIAVAISVGDCEEAEKLSHLRLSNYRVNPKREFFRIPPKIAMAIAYESCAAVNKKLGLPPPEKITFDKSTPKQYLQKISDPYDLAGIEMKREVVNKKDLKQAPIGTSELNALQIDRIRIIHSVFKGVNGIPIETTIENFTRDLVPEKEIQVWENMAKVYIEVDSQFGLTFEQKKDAFSLILMRSMCGELDFKKNMPKNSLSDTTVGHILKRYRGE